MRTGVPRRLTLLDAMALVVAVAVGLAVPRTLGDFVTVRREVRVIFRVDENSTTHLGVGSNDLMNVQMAALFRPAIKGQAIFYARHLAFWPAPCAAALSLATLALGVARSRPGRRRLPLRPGAVMAVAVVLSMAASAVRLPNLLLAAPLPASPVRYDLRAWWLECWFTLPRLAGFAVAVSWAALALTGRWRPEASGLDRLGIALGFAWLGMAGLSLAASWYEALPF